MAHHCHSAHPFPAQPLLQHSTDSDKHPGPIWQQRGPPVLSTSHQDPGSEEEAEQWANMGWDAWLPEKHVPVGDLVSETGHSS